MEFQGFPVKFHGDSFVIPLDSRHVLGNSCDMNQIMRIKKKYNLILIEDNCESLGAEYKGKQTTSNYILHSA